MPWLGLAALGALLQSSGNAVCTHLRKHAKNYEGLWAGDAPSPDATQMRDQGFQAYVQLVSKDGAWGGSLELWGFDATCDMPVYVFQPDKGERITVFNRNVEVGEA